MKKLLLTLLIITGYNSNAQLTVYEDSFETYPNFVKTGFGDWQTLDFDLLPTYVGGTLAGVNANWANAGTPMAYQIFTPSAANVSNSTATCNTTPTPPIESYNFDPKTGLKYAACWNAVPSTTGGNTSNNDWLVSPAVNLGASNNVLRFWVKSLSDCYGLEEYRVGIYVGSGTPTTATNFISLSGPITLTAPVTWEEKVINVPATYSNQIVRFGIRCMSIDHYMFMVDDFKVTSSTLGNATFLSSKFSTYPNPVQDVITVSSTDNIVFNEITITDINGRVIKNSKVNNLSQTDLNVSELNAGIYFLNITSDTGKAVKKFIKN